MALNKYLKKLYKRPKEGLGALWKERLIKYRREPAVVRLEKPVRIDRARALGYKAKEGYIVVRARVRRGGKKRPRPKKGRRSKRMTVKKVISKNYQRIAEERVAKRFPNCEVLGSYWTLKDGIHYWYEVLLADRVQVGRYKDMQWLGRGRVFRGLTSAGKKGRAK